MAQEGWQRLPDPHQRHPAVVYEGPVGLGGPALEKPCDRGFVPALQERKGGLSALSNASGMSLFESLQPGQRTNGLPRPLLRQPDFIKTLQVQPKFRAGAEKMSQTQRSVSGDGSPPIQDF